MKYFLLALFFCPIIARSQSDSIKLKSENEFSVSAYIETYFSFDFNKPTDNKRPSFFYSHNRHNEFNVNLALIKASYLTKNIRANISLAAGTYMNANYSAEPSTFKNIYEANAGIKISDQNLWIDAGIFSSHIGFESAISKDCWNVTRSIIAENTPYFESGAKITYITKNDKWLFSLLALNGWQRITRINASSSINLGTQIQYRPNTSTTFNYSTFVGTEFPDSTKKIRYYNNLFAILNLSKKVALTTGFDIGFQQITKASSKYSTWYSPIVLLKYSASPKVNLAGRVEYYHDKKGVIILAPTIKGFNTMGYSANVDYLPTPNSIIRLEFRTLHSDDLIFNKQDYYVKSNTFVTTSLAITF